MLRSYSCGYSGAYIVVKVTTDPLAAAANKNDKAEKNVAFRNHAFDYILPFKNLQYID